MMTAKILWAAMYLATAWSYSVVPAKTLSPRQQRESQSRLHLEIDRTFQHIF